MIYTVKMHYSARKSGEFKNYFITDGYRIVWGKNVHVDWRTREYSIKDFADLEDAKAYYRQLWKAHLKK